MDHKFPYRWNLSDGYPAKWIKKHRKKVFWTFICWGGSTMWYKLAWYEHVGWVELDPPIADIYKTNHNPKYLYNEDIRVFNNRNDLPEELYDLDLLDWSPPCSTFSMCWSREKWWGKEKIFREWQTLQTLDDLVFIYCDTIIKLQPKVYILENVSGIIKGNAKLYAKQIVEKMKISGYSTQVFCLNSASMWVPQRRERVFFIWYRNDLKFPKLKLDFNEKAILFREIKETWLPEWIRGKRWELWEKCKQWDNFWTVSNWNNFSSMRLSDMKVCNTITANQCEGFFHSTEKRKISDKECIQIWSFPMDFDFKKIRPMYLIWMSVPPVMTAQIANQIYLQWLK